MLFLNVTDLNLYPSQVIDTDYKVNMFFLRTKMTVVDGIVMGAIETFLEHGKDIESFVEKTPLCYVNLTSAEAITYDGYLVLAIKPIFNHEGCEKVDWSFASSQVIDLSQSFFTNVIQSLLEEGVDMD